MAELIKWKKTHCYEEGLGLYLTHNDVSLIILSLYHHFVMSGRSWIRSLWLPNVEQ